MASETNKLAISRSKKDNEPSELRHIWLALFGFYILLTETGVRQVMNVFVPSIMSEFNCTKTEADTAVIVMPTASSLTIGPLAAMFYQFFGARITIISGATLCSIGFTLGSFTRSMSLIYVYAVLIGIGCALMRNSIISVQCEYFQKRLNAVLSFISIGPGIGIFILPRIIVPMINNFSWNKAWQFLALLYVLSGVMGTFIARRSNVQHNSLVGFTGIKVWTNLEFVLHAVASFCASSVCIIYVSNILVLMRDEKITEPEVIYSYNGIASITGRALLTVIMGLGNIHIAKIMIVNYIIAQISLFSAIFCSTLWQFIIQNFLSGFGIGLFQATLSQFLLMVVKPTQLPEALGYTNFINGFAAFIAINTADKVSYIFGTIRAAFLVSVVLGISAIFFAIINSCILLMRTKEKKLLSNEEKISTESQIMISFSTPED